MIAPRMAGFRCAHSPSFFVTVMKSWPKNTPVTPSTSNSRSASGDCDAAIASSSSSFRCPGTSVIGIGKVPEPAPAIEATSGPGPSLPRSGGEHEDRNVLILVDEFQDFLGFGTLAEYALGIDAGEVTRACGEVVETAFRFFARFLAHEVADPEHLLHVLTADGDGREQHELAARAGSAPRGVIDRAVAFRRLIDDDQEFPQMSGLETFSLRAHRFRSAAIHMLPRARYGRQVSDGPARQCP